MKFREDLSENCSSMMMRHPVFMSSLFRTFGTVERQLLMKNPETELLFQVWNSHFIVSKKYHSKIDTEISEISGKFRSIVE